MELIKAERIINEEERFNFLPTLFGLPSMLRGETLVYQWMAMLSPDYHKHHGLWDFYKLSNGGFYMKPQGSQRLRIVSQNQFEGIASADAAGIIATLYAVCQLANTEQKDHQIEAYYRLRDFALEHEESTLILQAID